MRPIPIDKPPIRNPKPVPTSYSELVSNARKHFATITHHRMVVCRLCVLAGLPWQGLTHDLSKYAPTEFMTGVRYFQGSFSPNAAERELEGYSKAWLHHKGRNRHHFEYWTDILKGYNGRMVGVPMPTRYVIEMFCDRIAASKVYEKENYRDDSALRYFSRELSLGELPMHPDTQAFLLVLLEMLADEGEETTFRFIRETIVEPRFIYTEGGKF